MRKSKLRIGYLTASLLLFSTCSHNKSTAPVLTVPKITTAAVSLITETSAKCGGTISSDGGSAITARGVCWSTNTTPTIADNKTSDSIGTGSFVSSIIDLTGGTPYYVRAYATNTTGTGYGSAVSFTTSPVPPEANWTLRSSGGLYDFRDVSNDGITVVAVGDSGRIVTSADAGASWTVRSAPFHGTLNAVASTATYGFVAVSSSAAGDSILFSDSGATWIARTTSGVTGNLNDAAGFGSLLLAVACNGQTYTSTNGVSWTKWTNGGPCVEAVKRCGLDSAQYVAVGQSGYVVTSSNGSNWIVRTSSGNWLRDVACGCSKAVAVGDGGTIRVSTNGISWTTVATVGVNLTAVVCSGDTFVAVGENGVVYTSSDAGASWKERTSQTTKNLYGVTLIGSTYVAVGLDGTVITSP